MSLFPGEENAGNTYAKYIIYLITNQIYINNSFEKGEAESRGGL